jgi:hypothetical protein
VTPAAEVVLPCMLNPLEESGDNGLGIGQLTRSQSC